MIMETRMISTRVLGWLKTVKLLKYCGQNSTSGLVYPSQCEIVNVCKACQTTADGADYDCGAISTGRVSLWWIQQCSLPDVYWRNRLKVRLGTECIPYSLAVCRQTTVNLVSRDTPIVKAYGDSQAPLTYVSWSSCIILMWSAVKIWYHCRYSQSHTSVPVDTADSVAAIIVGVLLVLM